MAMKYLGDTLDIHTGGVDLTFPHHENEIAQSEAATGKPFVRYWMHAEHLLVDSEKMSKSLGNFFTLRELLAKGHKPSTLRFLLASVPYRRQLNFSDDSLKQAASSVERLRNFATRLRNRKVSARRFCIQRKRRPRGTGVRSGTRRRSQYRASACGDFRPGARGQHSHGSRRVPRRGRCAGTPCTRDIFDAIFVVLGDDDAEKLRSVGIGGDSQSPERCRNRAAHCRTPSRPPWTRLC